MKPCGCTRFPYRALTTNKSARTAKKLRAERVEFCSEINKSWKRKRTQRAVKNVFEACSNFRQRCTTKEETWKEKGRRERETKEKKKALTPRAHDSRVALEMLCVYVYTYERMCVGSYSSEREGEQSDGILPFSRKWSPRVLWGFSWWAISTYYKLVARGPPSLT